VIQAVRALSSNSNATKKKMCICIYLYHINVPSGYVYKIYKRHTGISFNIGALPPKISHYLYANIPTPPPPNPTLETLLVLSIWGKRVSICSSFKNDTYQLN
jgi:hypothetical protein